MTGDPCIDPPPTVGSVRCGRGIDHEKEDQRQAEEALKLSKETLKNLKVKTAVRAGHWCTDGSGCF
jgi:hypothetical protein